MSDFPWPQLEWTVTGQKVNWLMDRTRELALRARAFEVALEEASAAGEAPLSKAAEALADWEHFVANLWMYAGLGEAKQVPAEDVHIHAEELAKVYGSLIETREKILEVIGADAAKKVVAREKTAKVDDAQVKLRAGELPRFGETDALGNVFTPPVAGDAVKHPITPDELKSRMAAEQKALPDNADFKTHLSLVPPAWIAAIFETYGLPMPESDDDEEAELTSNSRSTIQKKLLVEKMSPELLREAVFALDDKDRELLSELLQNGGALRYSEAMNKYGRDDADGFMWTARPPSGPIARLRRIGVAFVGMRGGKQLLAIPSDLQKALKTILAG
ncbi:MAG: hypothetical protein ACJ790_16615 [Myxococcaceae bacterium]